MSGQTPWQTVGPFFHYGLPWKGGADLVEGGTGLGARLDLIPEGHYVLNPDDEARTPVPGPFIEIGGIVLDGKREPIPDALVEIWQANALGRYASPEDNRTDIALEPGFIGFGRSATGPDGRFTLRTLKPGRVPGPGNSLQAPHIAVSLMGRGILKRMVTRIYFADEPSNAEDPILALVPGDRQKTLLAVPVGEGRYTFDLVIQGAEETVFFDV